jgi:disulfide bond formation protein DsbB
MPSNRTILIAIAIACFGVIGVALYLQHAKDMLPCPLCVLQRYAFIITGIFALIAAFAPYQKVWAALALVSTAWGGLTVRKHIEVISNPGFTCGIDPLETMLNKIPTATGMPWLFRADGLCESAGDPVMGLSVPHWSALWMGIILLSVLFVLARRVRQ